MLRQAEPLQRVRTFVASGRQAWAKGHRCRNVLQVVKNTEHLVNDAWRQCSKKFSPSSPQLLHCLTLALLLHIWLVLVVGNAPSGTAKPGDGVWGSLNVTLRGPRVDSDQGVDASPALATPATAANAGPVGSGRQQRFGGAVRPITAPTDLPRMPGAARLGAWSATPATEASPAAQTAQPQPPLVAAEPVPSPVPVPRVGAPLTENPSPSPLRLLSLDAAPQSMLARLTPPELTPTVSPSPLSRLEPLPQRESVSAPPVQAAPASISAQVPVPTPVPAATPPVPLQPAAISREAIELRSALPSVLPPVLAPALTSVPQQLVAKPVLAAPESARIAPPERLPAANFELEAKTTPSPEIAPQAQSTPIPITAAAVNSAAVTHATAGAAVADPAATEAAKTAALSASPAAAKTLIDPGLLGLVPGAPDAGPRVGHDVATPPSASASAPRLNLQWVPPRGGELSSRGSRGVLQLLPVPPEHKSKLAEEMEKAGKVDCRKAYSGIGLLAALPLALDAAGSKGCQW